MQGHIPGNVIAACFGLSAFAVALISGLAAGRSAANILSAATLALIVCYALGFIIARVAGIAVRDAAEAATRKSRAKASSEARDHAVQEAA
ncbi:MAG: hypothetical protein KDA20_00020 [Phycisphaerales bacterium]|nr:hypothetical protein [Phycisphaerales bacterium]